FVSRPPRCNRRAAWSKSSRELATSPAADRSSARRARTQLRRLGEDRVPTTTSASSSRLTEVAGSLSRRPVTAEYNELVATSTWASNGLSPASRDRSRAKDQ